MSSFSSLVVGIFWDVRRTYLKPIEPMISGQERPYFSSYAYSPDYGNHDFASRSTELWTYRRISCNERAESSDSHGGQLRSHCTHIWRIRHRKRLVARAIHLQSSRRPRVCRVLTESRFINESNVPVGDCSWHSLVEGCVVPVDSYLWKEFY